MSGEINRVPLGLLALLDMKSRGNNPRMLSAEVSSTVDLTPLYLQQNRRWRALNTTPAAVGFFIVHTVPEGELWYINRIVASSALVLAAGTEYVVGIGCQRVDDIGSNRQAALGQLQPWRFLAGDRLGVGFEGPMWASPGDGFGLWVADVVLGTAALITVNVDYTPVPI